MPFVRRTPKLSSRLFVWGTWVFFAAILYLLFSVVLSLAGKEMPGVFSPSHDTMAVQATVPAPPPPGSVLSRPASILDQSVTRNDEGRQQVQRLLQESSGQ